MSLKYLWTALVIACVLHTGLSASDALGYFAYNVGVPADTQSTVVRGVPFLKASLWNPAIEGETLALDKLGVYAEYVYILGCENSVDEVLDNWAGGNPFRNFFLGDSAGTLKIKYESGKTDVIPLVFGYNVWWRKPYNGTPEPFKSEAKTRKLLDTALHVANGIEGGENLYFIKIKLRSETVQAISLEDNPVKVGHFTVDGISFASVRETQDQSKYKSLAGGDSAPAATKWMQQHTIDSTAAYPKAAQKAVDSLCRRLYTYLGQVNSKTIRATKPDITEANYPGPKVTFLGTPDAELLTNIYYENSHQLLTRVDEKGGLHESAAKAPYFPGFGGCVPELGAFHTNSYTRLRSLTLLSNAGFDLKVEKAINYFDKWLMYFPRSFPEVQLGGKPVPGHAPVIANTPHCYYDSLRLVGWPTKYKVRDFGNGENDGHGMLMLSRWRAWLKGGQNPKWVNKHWEALNEAAEYIPWCLDNPDLSFSEHGLLYSESEGGMMIESMYCDFNCYLGLLGYAEIAESIGRQDKATRWREQAQRLFNAMEAYYPLKSDKWGDVWDTGKTATWVYGHAVLAPVIIGMDYWGYDVINRLPKGWAERTRNTYKMQVGNNIPKYCATAGMGYGQCYITESALLLDEMNDASNMVEWMGRVCFAPTWPHSYRVPEGVSIAGDGSRWRRWGDLGNLYQLGEVVYTIHVVLGIEDIDPATVTLMPRIPMGWTGAQVKDWPVRTLSGGKSDLVKLSIAIERDKACRKMTVKLDADKIVDACRVRLGPFTKDSKALSAVVDGKCITADLFDSGDSKWAWISVKGLNCSASITASVSK